MTRSNASGCAFAASMTTMSTSLCGASAGMDVYLSSCMSFHTSESGVAYSPFASALPYVRIPVPQLWTYRRRLPSLAEMRAAGDGASSLNVIGGVGRVQYHVGGVHETLHDGLVLLVAQLYLDVREGAEGLSDGGVGGSVAG